VSLCFLTITSYYLLRSVQHISLFVILMWTCMCVCSASFVSHCRFSKLFLRSMYVGTTSDTSMNTTGPFLEMCLCVNVFEITMVDAQTYADQLAL